MNMANTVLHGPALAEFIRGAIALETTGSGGILPHRLPAWALAQCRDPQLAMAESQPSGVRLVFQTEATTLELVTLPTKRIYPGMPARPDGVVDLLVDGRLAAQASAPAGRQVRMDFAGGSTVIDPGHPQRLRFDGLADRLKTIELWLPHDETTELLALHADAPLHPDPEPARRSWLHHGSSISHGSNASHPSGTWPAVAARLAGVDLVNLGFGGNALLDPFTARTMRDAPADVISVKIGINLVNRDLMRLRAFGPAVHGFLDTIREGHPRASLLVISPLLCPIHETTPGPTAFDPASLAAGKLNFQAAGKPDEIAQGKLTLESIRAQLRDIVAQRARADERIHYLDGTLLYGPEDSERLPLPDGLHPDAAAQGLIGERFAALAFADGPFRKAM